MGFVLFVLGFIIGFLICLAFKNLKELNELKNNYHRVKPLSAMNKKEFKKAMEDLEIK